MPDFYCEKEKLAVELDGKIHLYTKRKDAKRDKILNSLGIKVLRIENEELQNIQVVLARIKSLFEQ